LVAIPTATVAKVCQQAVKVTARRAAAIYSLIESSLLKPCIFAQSVVFRPTRQEQAFSTMANILAFLLATLAGTAIPDHCIGPEGVVIASCPIASIIRSQTATPARSSAGRKFLGSF
jgi:hypothetical protein